MPQFSHLFIHSLKDILPVYSVNTNKSTVNICVQTSLHFKKPFLKPCKYAIVGPFIVASDLPIPFPLPILSNELISTIFIFPFYNPVVIPGMFILKTALSCF